MREVDATWYLETLAKDGTSVVHEVRKPPFRVGRDPTSDVAEATMGLSRRHAEAAGLPHACLELRQDGIDTPAGVAVFSVTAAASV